MALNRPNGDNNSNGDKKKFELKGYVTVQTRINKFWEDHPDGRIKTTLQSDPSNFGQCRYLAEVYVDAADEFPIATGWAFETAGKGMVNGTSHEENCETSAIGRALANMGYATSENRASVEEMEKAERGRSLRAVESEPQNEVVDQDSGEIMSPEPSTPSAPEDVEEEERPRGRTLRRAKPSGDDDPKP